MKTIRCLVVAALVAMTTVSSLCPAAAELGLKAPTAGEVVRMFQVGEHNWEPGHRGVDIASGAGAPVIAAADGKVRFAGNVAGRGVVSLDHGGLRTTYEPVLAAVAAGASIAAGQVIGYVQVGHAGCPVSACLHWGLTDGTSYFNPLDYLSQPSGSAQVRLLPSAALATGTSTEGLLWPAAGRPGSGFGMRMHPILGYARMHAGTDIGAACGSDLLAPATGVVVSRTFNEGNGNYLVMDLGVVDGSRLVVGFSHAASYQVSPGDRVVRGQVVGKVGSTGLSTGCHLHLSVKVAGEAVDPLLWFTPP